MKIFPHYFAFIGRNIAFAIGITLAMEVSKTEAAVTAGGLAVIGFTDNRDSGDPLSDTFTIVALEEIAENTVVYFTDNGWIDIDGKFTGANLSSGAGTETLLKLTFTSSVAAGTIMRSGFDSAGFTWDLSTLIPGDVDEYFSLLNLSSNASSGSPIGDQIYIFEASSSTLPLSNVSNAIYQLELGDFENPGFEDALTTSQGNILPGLSVLANTAWIMNDPDDGDDPGDFHNGSFALYLDDADVLALQASGGTKAQWLALIADENNWWRSEFDISVNPDPDLEDLLVTFGSLNVVGVPEPSRALLVCGALLGALLRRRRF
jgi:hypothetical protein